MARTETVSKLEIRVNRNLRWISIIQYVGDWRQWDSNLRRSVSAGKKTGVSG